MNIEKNISTLKWFTFFDGFGLYAPLAIIYYSKITGSFALGISVFSVEMLSAALLEVPTGIFSDKIGRKRTVILGAICGVTYITLYTVASNYVFLFIGAVIAGLARSFYSGNNNALLHDTLLELKQVDKFPLHLGKVGSMEQMALGISAVLGGIIATRSLRATFGITILSQLICLGLSLRLIEPAVHTKESGNIYAHLIVAIKEFFTNKKLRLLTLASSTTYALGESSFQFRSAFYQMLWPVWAIGLAQALSNLGASISFNYSGRILKKFGALKSLVVGSSYGRVANIIGTAFPTVFSPIIMSSSSLLYGLQNVAKESLLQKEYKQQQRATMGSLNSFAGSILFAIVSISLGTIADALNPAKALLIMTFVSVFTIIFYLLIARHDRIAKQNS